MSVSNLFSSIGLNKEQAVGLLQQMYQSGSLRAEFLKPLFEHIRKSEEVTDTPEDQKMNGIRSIIYPSSIENAAKKSLDENEKIDLEYFSKEIEKFNISDRFMLALMQASFQRHFLPEVVVNMQNPTKYSEINREPILKLAEKMGMTQEERINSDGGKSEKVDIGIAIGATTKTMQDYLIRQKRILENSTNPEYDSNSYSLNILIGNRALVKQGKDPLPSDNPKESSENFTYNDKDESGNQIDYLTYLSKTTGIVKENLTEGDAMKERFEQVFGTSVELSKEQGWLKTIIAKNAQEFIEKTVDSIPDDGQKRKVAMTTVQPFNRTYESNISSALANAGKSNITISIDGGVGGAVRQPQTIMREFAKIINGAYKQIARENNIETPVDPTILNGAKMKAIEAQIIAGRQVVMSA